MAGFVETLTERERALNHVSAVLGFPWSCSGRSSSEIPLFGRVLHPLKGVEDFPPFSRSTRDGYAVQSADCLGATAGSPAFMTMVGEVPMGELPTFSVGPGECALIHTGGALPEGADGVVMAEDTERAGEWIEIRKAVQKGENIIGRGEEFARGDELLNGGGRTGFRTAGLLAMAGIKKISLARFKVGIISTGDEIVPPDVVALPPGKVRDVNASILEALLASEGYSSRYYGIAEDSPQSLSGLLKEALADCDAVVISGGSSVSVRDYCSSILENLPPPGLLVRGILMSPGKPTLIAGMAEEKKLVLGLPGHPFSCFISAYSVLLPLLNGLIWGDLKGPWKSLRVTVQEPVFSHSGVEEFIPCVLKEGAARPFPVKSSFSRALAEADGIFRIPVDQETVRPGEEAEIWLW